MFYRFRNVKVQIIDKDFLAKIPLEKLALFLKRSGWQVGEDYVVQNRVCGQFWSKYITANETSFILLPADQKFLDYPDRISEIISVLEATEEKNQLKIVEEIFEMASAPSLKEILRSNLLEWEFEKAQAALDGTEPAYTQKLVNGLANSFGDNSTGFDGNMAVIIRHALAHIGAVGEYSGSVNWVKDKVKDETVINRLFNWRFYAAQKIMENEQKEVRALIDALAETFGDSGDFSADGNMGIIVEAAVAHIGGYPE